MSYTQADLAKLQRALAAGVTTVEFNGRRTTYRSIEDLERAIAIVRAEVEGADSAPARRILMSSSRGL